MAENKFENRVNILAELWINYRTDKEFEDFVTYNDLGLPLAFMIAEELVKPSDLANSMINETYDLLLATLDAEDGDYDSLDDLLVG
jgi:hypothetical protein